MNLCKTLCVRDFLRARNLPPDYACPPTEKPPSPTETENSAPPPSCSHLLCHLPGNERHQTNVVLMLVHGVRCWPSINTTLGDWLVIAGWSAGTEEMGWMHYIILVCTCTASNLLFLHNNKKTVYWIQKWRRYVTLTHLRRWANL